ncbi:hypothetical protein H8S23_05255 [Anaerofilum sp. BX8]|uniref:Uncharacterized protein n=1 Tax=Anaerofilum hominis TaxID=2763016 RepID=A0A923ID69_9FIRM|nr:zinc ribbon domain-containing protein [Anaerofilum hominis]MBC5580905.1 hypothetical protein [Anaerofilum hominis]
MESKKKSELPGLTFFFVFTLVVGLLRELWTTYEMFVDYNAFWGTEYASIAAIDIGLRLIELAMYVGMLVFIALRKRTFLICFWVDYGCRVFSLLCVLVMGGPAASFLTPLVLPTIWAAYFYRSSNFAHAFTPYKPPFFSFEGMAPVTPAESPAGAADGSSSPQTPDAPAAAESVSPPSPPEAVTPQPAQEELPVSVPMAAPSESSAATSVATSPSSVPQAEAVPSSSAQHRFCKYCGAEYGPQDTVCPKCGKRVRYFSPSKPHVPLLAALLIISLVGNIILGVVSVKQSNEIKENQKVLDILASLSYEPKIGDPWENTIIGFSKLHVAIVTPNGEVYHAPGCQYLKAAKSLRIYSVSGAEQLDYAPCSVCH